MISTVWKFLRLAARVLPDSDDFSVFDQQIRIAVHLPGGIDHPAAFQ